MPIVARNKSCSSWQNKNMDSQLEGDKIQIHYRFWFENDREIRFRLQLDSKTLAPVKPLAKKLPDWTRLEFNRCPSCPLDNAEHPHCPTAARLFPVVSKIRDVVSTEPVKVAVTTPQRTVMRKSCAQEGLSSLIGVTMATSGCPHTAFFRPMARFHLPFADLDETAYRAVSTYLMAQYFRKTRGQDADLSMEGLHELYDQVSEVNRHMSERLQADKCEDGAVNAIDILDMFAKGLPPQFESLLDELEALFQVFLDPSPVELGQPAPPPAQTDAPAPA